MERLAAGEVCFAVCLRSLGRRLRRAKVDPPPRNRTRARSVVVPDGISAVLL